MDTNTNTNKNINMNIQDKYYNKYIKYKTKYLELKELNGGDKEYEIIRNKNNEGIINSYPKYLKYK